MICPRCNVEMKIGQAIKTEPSSLCLAIKSFFSLIRAEDLKIINCYKCPKCGHSDDGK